MNTESPPSEAAEHQLSRFGQLQMPRPFRSSWSSEGRSGPWVYISSVIVVSVLFRGAESRSVNWLLRVVPDDAFYYIGIARNIASMGISTFDGINRTNGYHPAWMAVLTLVAHWFSEPVTSIRIALGIALAFHLLSSACLVGVFSRWMPATLAWVGGAFWAGNPLALGFALQGMEASLYIFALSLCLYIYVSRVDRTLDPHEQGRSHRALALFGCGLGLAFLGRTEAIVLVGFVVVGVAARIGLRPSSVSKLAALLGAFVGVTLPWSVFSYEQTGHLSQDSGAMKLLWARHSMPRDAPQRCAQALRYVFGHWVDYPFLDMLRMPGSVRGIVNVGLTAAIVALLVLFLKNRRFSRISALGLLALTATTATGLVYGALFSDMQPWYRAQPGFILFVESYTIVALAGLRYLSRWSRCQTIVGSSLVGLSVLASWTMMNTIDSYPCAP